MSQSNHRPSGRSAEPTTPTEAAVYEPPRITHREPLEAVATACTSGTAKGNPVDCPTGPINS